MSVIVSLTFSLHWRKTNVSQWRNSTCAISYNRSTQRELVLSVSLLSKPHPTLPLNSQVSLTYYKRDCLPPPHSLVLLLLAFFPLFPLCPHYLSASLHVVMAGLYFSTLSFSLPFSASTTLLTPLPIP